MLILAPETLLNTYYFRNFKIERDFLHKISFQKIYSFYFFPYNLYTSYIILSFSFTQVPCGIRVMRVDISFLLFSGEAFSLSSLSINIILGIEFFFFPLDVLYKVKKVLSVPHLLMVSSWVSVEFWEMPLHQLTWLCAFSCSDF